MSEHKITVKNIRKRIKANNYQLTIHAFERCVERGISPKEIKDALLSGKMIEEYQRDKYGPSCLIYGISEEGKVLHVQCSVDPVWIITTYDPTLNPEE